MYFAVLDGCYVCLDDMFVICFTMHIQSYLLYCPAMQLKQYKELLYADALQNVEIKMISPKCSVNKWNGLYKMKEDTHDVKE